MSKVSSNAQIGGSNKPSIKQKNPLRGSHGKLTLDLKNLKSDVKNLVPGTTVAYEKHSQSPKLPSEKTSHPLTKSPRTKYNPSKLTIETSDHKDALNVEKKIYPQTTKAQHTPSISSNFDKFKKPSNINEKADGSKAKESQIKEMLSSYENVFGKKGGEGKDSSKLEANSKYSNKTKIMEEPPKKASMPNTLSLTLNNIYTNTGSSSHRAPLNSPPSDRTNINNAQALYASLNRKNSQKSDVDLEQQAANLVMNSQHLPQHNLNNLLVDLASISSEHMKGGVSKININSINNINTINNNIATGDRLPSPKESNNSSSQYNDLLRLLNEKNKEIQRLSHDKVELKSTLDVLSSEISNLKKMKILVKEKEKAIENLQHSLTDAIKESEDLKRDMLNGSQDGTGSQHLLHHHFGVRKGNNPSIGDIEGIKALIHQLKGITDSSGEVGNDSLEQKTHLLETITKENHHSKLKKSDLSYNSFNLESRIERGSQSKEVVPDIYNRNFSETLDAPYGKKANESPYYDALKTTKKNLKANTGAKKGSIGSKKLISESQTIKPSTANTGNSKKGDSLLGTPRKPQIHTEIAEKQYKIQPHTTTGTDINLFKRKFSHDPKLISDTLTDNLNKKKLQADKKATGHRMPSQDHHRSHTETLDIGKALSGIKDRIGMMLSKHRDDQKKLKTTHDVYLKKLDTLLNN